MSTQDFLPYGFVGIAVSAIWYLIISYATRADRQVKNQEAIFDLLEKIAKQQGVSEEEIQGIRYYRGMK